MALAIDIVRVNTASDGLSFPVINLLNRRAGGAPRLLRWVCQRHLEIVLFNRGDGGSSGAIWKALNATGLNATGLNATVAQRVPQGG